MEVLRSRIFAKRLEEKMEKERAARKSQIGFGMRSEKIRTYNFPQDRITDHRLGISWHNLPGILDGEIEEITEILFKRSEKQKLITMDTEKFYTLGFSLIPNIGPVRFQKILQVFKTPQKLGKRRFAIMNQANCPPIF